MRARNEYASAVSNVRGYFSNEAMCVSPAFRAGGPAPELGGLF
jgi:hypothetical protein